MSRIIKVGIVGLGRAGIGMHSSELAEYPDRFAIAAACDHAKERLENLPERFKGAKLYTDYSEMLQDDNVELVSIATRHPEHVPMALQALEAGKYVNIDKPYALNNREMAQLAEADKKYPGRIFLRHNRRYEAPFQKAMKLIATGVLGEINTVKLYRSVGYCRRNDWMTMTEFGGGLFTNWGPHIIDQALQYLDSPVVDLWANIRSIISIGDGDDHIKLLLKAANGRVADIEISGAHTLPGRELEIQGSRGTLIYPVDGRIKMRYVDPEIEFKPLKPHPENPPMKYGNFDETLTFIEQFVEIPPIPMSEIWKHVYDAIVNKVPYPITIENGIAVTDIMEKAFRKSNFKPAERFL
ncbi:Gfo/Idh/MocA family oxidoreductase [uncultured Victivallis sp.]|uniref:Gfo/Idh/MocA family protein n=1 Tax=uncultured Victivallis sp. TaxID=354118 RepID=UPI0025D3F85F|nr:Gfo/Idh/MocA family oxidoreductase [uncultured Victivallis sp.]